jgi:hypothetical protein
MHLDEKYQEIKKDLIKDYGEGMSALQISIKYQLNNNTLIKKLRAWGVSIRSNQTYIGRVGRTPWNKGKRYTQITGERNYLWKGNKVSYSGLHHWVKRMAGKAAVCSDCGSTENVHWANVSGEYMRNLDDFVELCLKCHRKKDNWSEKMWSARRATYAS